MNKGGGRTMPPAHITLVIIHARRAGPPQYALVCAIGEAGVPYRLPAFVRYGGFGCHVDLTVTCLYSSVNQEFSLEYRSALVKTVQQQITAISQICGRTNLHRAAGMRQYPMAVLRHKNRAASITVAHRVGEGIIHRRDTRILKSLENSGRLAGNGVRMVFDKSYERSPSLRHELRLHLAVIGEIRPVNVTDSRLFLTIRFGASRRTCARVFQ